MNRNFDSAILVRIFHSEFENFISRLIENPKYSEWAADCEIAFSNSFTRIEEYLPALTEDGFNYFARHHITPVIGRIRLNPQDENLLVSLDKAFLKTVNSF